MTFRRSAIWILVGVLVSIAWLAATVIGEPEEQSVADSVKPPLTSTSSATLTASPVAISSSAVVVGVAQVHLTVNQRRRDLFDAANVLDAVKRAQLAGSPDEKGWAAGLLKECYAYVSKEQQIYLSTESPSVEAQRLAAFEALQTRCLGVGELDWPTRRAMTAELAAAAAASTSELQTLITLQDRHERGDTRWNQAESKLVADALYGDDPLIRRAGFLALWSAIDDKAPGGRERRDSLLFAGSDKMLNPPLSEFERLQQCARAGICGQAESAPEASPGRLRALYSDALGQRRSPETILAIR